MNCDNKFAFCCKCPAMINKPREFTQWTTGNLRDINMMKQKGITNAYDYKSILQTNAENIIKTTMNSFDDNYKCKNSDNNLFYLDSSNYNNLYNGIIFNDNTV
jgi:hypothetical protein